MPNEVDKIIEVGGLRVATRVTGSGTPPVVMLSSSGGAHEQWQQLRERLGDTTCLSYGRPGLAGSDPLPPEQAATPRAASWAASHLHDLLRAAEVPAPYVLVSCSVGGYIADRFAAAWPDELAGIVQVDPTYIVPLPRLTRDKPIDDADGSGILFSWDLCRTELEQHPPVRPRRAVVISRAFGTIPLAVVEKYWHPLTPSEIDEGWRRTQTVWAQRLGAAHIAANTGGHHVQIDQPDLVAHAVQAVITAATADEDLVLDQKAVAAAGGLLLN